MLDSRNSDPDAWIETMDLSEVATPAFVYSSGAVTRRIKALQEALGTKVIVSFKASNQQDLMSRLPPEQFDGVEVASRGELHMVVGQQGRHFYVNTPALTEPLVRAGIGAKARFIIDTPDHLHMITKLRGARDVMPLTLRLSNKLVGQICSDAPKLRDDQFGMDMDQVHQAIALAKELGFAIDGLHLYAGPHTFRKSAHAVVDTMKVVLAEVEAALGHTVEILNLGGGLEEDWQDRGHDFAAYRAKMAELPARCEIIHEFGRAIFADCGCFVTRVIHAKEVSGQRYAICDGGMAQAFLLAQTENMMRKYRTPRLHDGDVQPLPEGQETIICGSTCSRDDVIGKAPFAITKGDVLVFDNCGAYTRTYSMNNFLQLGEATSYVL